MLAFSASGLGEFSENGVGVRDMSGRRRTRVLPTRLPAIGHRAIAWLRPLWFIVLAAAVLAQLSGAGYALSLVFDSNRAFVAIGLTSAIEYDGSISVSPVGEESRAQGVAADARILAIEGRPVPHEASAAAIAKRLRALPGPIVRLRVRNPDGGLRDVRLTRSPVHQAQAIERNPFPVSARMAIRLGFAALSAITLLISAMLLFLRRPRDPVAVLISFAFLSIVTVIDPPLQMWMGLRMSLLVGVATGVWWTAMVIALAAFPDGRFEPRWLRSTLLWAPVIGIFLALDLEDDLTLMLGTIPPILLLAAQVVRYRRVGAGIERQQIKWAAFGFAAGFALLGLSLVLASYVDPDAWVPMVRTIFYLTVVCLFSLSFALMALGLMISLLRYRLWEADRVISQSAAYAIVTLVVGLVFAAVSDVAKLIIGSMFGVDHATLSTAVGAILATAVFGPTQTLALRWSKRRFTKATGRLRQLPDRLRVWRNSLTRDELGLRALAIITQSIHAEGGVLLMLTPGGRDVVAAIDVPNAQGLAAPMAPALAGGDSRFPLIVELEDGDGPVGTLLLGPRSDHNRYNKDERAALGEVTEPLAEALRVAQSRSAHDDGLHRMLSAVEERLQRLERGGPEPGLA
jgi:hypothetical protein